MKILIPLLLLWSLAACDRREAQATQEESRTTDTAMAVPAPTGTAADSVVGAPTAPPGIATCEGMTGQEKADCLERERARPPIQPPETSDIRDETTPP